ncbi:MAG: hypothetical protein ABMA01_14950 [Chthoniobacteraceae bacterium]
MHFGSVVVFRALPLVVTLALGCVARGAEVNQSKAAAEAAKGHAREELGVNEFTTPSIETVLQALRDLRPMPYDSVARDPSPQNPPDRAKLALSTGGTIAEGLLAVAAEKQARIEPIGRVLLRQAKGLGVAEHVTRHSKSIIDKAATKDWPGIRAELIGTQRDVEKGMLALKDEEIAHLVALGGWWRGLEMTTGIISAQYSPERAALLVQPAVLDYFADRVSKLNPAFQTSKLWAALSGGLREVRRLAVKDSGAPPTVEEVRSMLALARLTNELVNAPSE